MVASSDPTPLGPHQSQGGDAVGPSTVAEGRMGRDEASVPSRVFEGGEKGPFSVQPRPSTQAPLRTHLEDWNLPFTDADFLFIADLVRHHAGIDLTLKKRDMVYARLSKRVRTLGLRSFADYCAVLSRSDGEAERGAAVNAITTNLTRFFRESHHFDHLMGALRGRTETVLNTPGQKRRLRIWSAGCSTGEEAYSIALCLASVLGRDGGSIRGHGGITPAMGQGWDARILATDIDTDVLAVASRGQYSTEALAHIPSAFQKSVRADPSRKWFELHPAVRDLVSFKPLNLLGSWPMQGPFDAIFCRNVAIYFNRADQIRLFTKIADLLAPDGYLYIGHSENLFGVSGCFQLVARTIYRKVG